MIRQMLGAEGFKLIQPEEAQDGLEQDAWQCTEALKHHPSEPDLSQPDLHNLACTAPRQMQPS